MNRLKKNALILFTLIIIFISLSFGFGVEAASKVSGGSMIGGVVLEGLTKEEARQKLLTEVELWQSEEPLIATYDNGSLVIPRELFDFQIDASLEELIQQTKQPWYLFFLKDKSAQLPLVVSINEEVKRNIFSPSYIDLEATLLQAQNIASYLGNAEMTATFSKDGAAVQEKIATVVVEIPSTYVALERLVAELNGKTINSASHFSFLKSVVVPIEVSQSGKEMNFVASALYALMLKSNVDIVERHPQSEVANYLEPGVEAKVSQYEEKDLLFYNPNQYSYTVEAEIKGNELVLSLYSVALETTYEYRVENKVEIPQRTVYRFSKDLRPRQQKTIDLGEKGLRVSTYRLSYSNKGNLLNKELLSKDFYSPSPKVVLVSTIEPPVDTSQDNMGTISDGDHHAVHDDPNDPDDLSADDDIKGYEIVDLEEGTND